MQSFVGPHFERPLITFTRRIGVCPQGMLVRTAIGNRVKTRLIYNDDRSLLLPDFFRSGYGLATNYYGVTHPSQPNYIAATSGSTNTIADDNDTTINVPNIVDQLEAHGKTWKAYMQSLSLCGPADVKPGVNPKLAHVCGNQQYERKHDPFITYQDVQTNPARMENIVDFSQFATDLTNNTVPDYSWISPDQCNDMHGRSGPADDTCNFGSSSTQALIAAGMPS